MGNYKKICKNPYCRKEFKGSRTQQYCCVDCRVDGQKKQINAPKKSSGKTLVDDVREARRLGLTYGKYKALLHSGAKL